MLVLVWFVGCDGISCHLRFEFDWCCKEVHFDPTFVSMDAEQRFDLQMFHRWRYFYCFVANFETTCQWSSNFLHDNPKVICKWTWPMDLFVLTTQQSLFVGSFVASRFALEPRDCCPRFYWPLCEPYHSARTSIWFASEMKQDSFLVHLEKS